MLLDRETCIGCGACAPYCPMNAIKVHKKNKASGKKAYAEIQRDECVECSVCYRSGVCPTNSFRQEELKMPRVLRAFFSDPWFSHPGTDIPGRGTEEMKTNEVTHRFKDGFIGIDLEFGRPGLGCRLKDTEQAIKKLLPIGIKLEPCNPLTELIDDMKTGHIRDDVREEKVLSAIVEAIIPIEQCQSVFQAIKELSREVETVFSTGIIAKVAPDGHYPGAEQMKKAGLTPSINGKVNLGLGKSRLSEV